MIEIALPESKTIEWSAHPNELQDTQRDKCYEWLPPKSWELLSLVIIAVVIGEGTLQGREDFLKHIPSAPQANHK